MQNEDLTHITHQKWLTPIVSPIAIQNIINRHSSNNILP